MGLSSTIRTTVLMGVSFTLLAAVACAEEYVPPTPMPPAPPAPASTAVVPEVADPDRRPPSPPTPTLEERRVQTPTDFGYNTRVVDGDIHVWHVPHCPPVPPATFIASIILTHLVPPYSYLCLNRDGSVRESPVPDYRTDESRERFVEATLKEKAWQT